MGNDEGWKVGDSASHMGRIVKVTKIYPIGDPRGRFQVDGKHNVNQLHKVIDDSLNPSISSFSQIGFLKDKKFLLELLWCFLGGLGFVVLTALFESGANFRVMNNILNLKYWGGHYGNIEEFIFGFIITGIIIWSIKTYKKL